VVQLSLDAFQADGPTRRVLFLLTEGTREKIHQEKNSQTSKIREIADQARTAGVAVFAVSLAPTAHLAALQNLTSTSGGHLWEVNAPSDLHLACLRFYEHLEQPQEAPIKGGQVLLDKWIKQALVVAARSVPGKGVVLTSPRGAKITSRMRAKNTRWLARQAYDLITISRPQPGVWSLARARPGGSRVFLKTAVTFNSTGTPREVGEDEVLMVTAILRSKKKTRTRPDLLSGTQFRAELQIPHNAPLTIDLKTPDSPTSPDLPPGTRVGRFPPLHQEGEGTLKIVALGKTFQRLVSLPITITQPWYRAAQAETKAQGSPPLRFHPAAERHPGQVVGTLTLKSAQGALAGALINPAPGAEIILVQPPDCKNSCLADLYLKGTTPGGRSLVIASHPRRLETSGRVADPPSGPSSKTVLDEQAHASKPLSLTQKIKRRWFWLTLSALGIVIFLASVALLIRQR
jgi:hypothetical protein